MLQRVHRRPILALVLTCNGLLLGVQLWIFGWAPVSGHGLDVALGYLLLPLIMVVVGRVIHREHLPRLQVAAVAAAAIGVISAIVLAGGISPAAVAVALGYPIYFELRARFQVNTPGALALELATLVPVAIVLAFLQSWPATGTAELALGLLTIGLVSTVALLLYLRASELLPFGLFGLLTYVEPVLLAIVSITILRESLTPIDLLIYGPIDVALCLLGIENTTARRHPGPPPG